MPTPCHPRGTEMTSEVSELLVPGQAGKREQIKEGEGQSEALREPEGAPHRPRPLPRGLSVSCPLPNPTGKPDDVKRKRYT